MIPAIETKITTSKNGRWLIHRTILTHIMATDYYRAILANAISVPEEDLTDEDMEKICTQQSKRLK